MDRLAMLVLGLAAAATLWAGTAGITVWLARRRGGSALKWGLFGLLLGPLGVLLALRMVRPCPRCAAPVLREIHDCPRCGAQIPRLDPGQNPSGPLWSYRRDW